MTLAELKAEMMSGRMRQIYIFTGTEIEVRGIYLKQIAKLGKFEIKWIDEVSDIIQSSRKKSMIASKSLYVLSESSEILKNDKALEAVQRCIGKNMLVCMFTTLDKRVKLYKQYKDIIVEFETLKSEILKKYIQKEIGLSDKNCTRLMEICENDYGRCLLEIDKIKRFHIVTERLYDQSFISLLQDGTIYQPAKDVIFDFVDAVMQRDAYTAFKLMQESYDSGEATLVMISNLYSNFKATLQVKSCKSRDIAKSTGLNTWQINNAKKHIGNYSVKELINAMQIIRNAEVGIKSGLIDEEVAVPQILVNIL